MFFKRDRTILSPSSYSLLLRVNIRKTPFWRCCIAAAFLTAVPRKVPLWIIASQSCPQLPAYQAFSLDPAETANGVSFPFLVECQSAASPGFS